MAHGRSLADNSCSGKDSHFTTHPPEGLRGCSGYKTTSIRDRELSVRFGFKLVISTSIPVWCEQKTVVLSWAGATGTHTTREQRAPTCAHELRHHLSFCCFLAGLFLCVEGSRSRTSLGACTLCGMYETLSEMASTVLVYSQRISSLPSNERPLRPHLKNPMNMRFVGGGGWDSPKNQVAHPHTPLTRARSPG